MDDNRRRAASRRSADRKQFGRGAVMRMGDRSAEAAEVVPTGSPCSICAWHRQPLPRGRVVESPVQVLRQDHADPADCRPITSAPAALPLRRRRACPRPPYAEKLGVNVDDLLVSQPDTGEQALEIADVLVRSNAVDMVVVDSVAADAAEIGARMGDQLPGPAGAADKPGPCASSPATSSAAIAW